MKKHLILFTVLCVAVIFGSMVWAGKGPATGPELAAPCGVEAVFDFVTDSEVCVTWAVVPNAVKYSIDFEFLNVVGNGEIIVTELFAISFASKDYENTALVDYFNCDLDLEGETDGIEMCIPLADFGYYDEYGVWVPFDFATATDAIVKVKGLNPGGAKRQNNPFAVITVPVDVPDEVE